VSWTHQVNRIMGAANRRLYRASGGKIGGSFRGAPVLLLTTTGRKSGKQRTMPLLYLREGDAFVVVASEGGAERNPAWFLNLQANPAVEVEVGRAKEQRRARAATDEERARLWPRLVEMYPPYEAYQQKTARKIPVVLLEP
jgi:deazaflavin-dependent oxidoreductase (nitroreductase family)